jgi:hypothetical protein
MTTPSKLSTMFKLHIKTIRYAASHLDIYQL